MRDIETIRVANSSVDQLQASWSFSWQRALFLTAFQQAIDVAEQKGHAVLVSITQAVPIFEPLVMRRAIEMLAIGDCIYWQQSLEELVFVGGGAAKTIIGHGSERIAEMTSEWQTLLRHAVIRIADKPEGEPPLLVGGPVLLGGFSFDPLRSTTALWQEFPEGLLILPRLLLSSDGQRATLTINCMVQLDDENWHLTCAVSELLNRLQLEFQKESKKEYKEERSVPIAVHDILSAEQWKELVVRTSQRIREGEFEKVVLARSVDVFSETQEPFSVDQTLHRLTRFYHGAHIFALQRGPQVFLGATPERLVWAKDGQLRTVALAGSMPRGKNKDEDELFGRELLNSEKNKIEHAIVIAMVREALQEICSHVEVALPPHLCRLKNIQHLETSIVGILQPEHNILEAVECLLPTPAVGGMPRDKALAMLREEEQLDRGWYAGAVGWMDAVGNGDFAVALRSGLVEGRQATLFGGCGIVGDSLPESEYNESCWKLQVMLRGLSGEE